MEFRKEKPAKREKDFGLENALAGWCRRRWPDKTIAHVAHYFGLSEHAASKIVYALASKNALKELLHHPKGGPKLFIELVCDATSYSLERYIEEQAREAALEAARWEAEQRRLAILQARITGARGLGGSADQPARSSRPGAPLVGAERDGAAVEAKSFDPKGRRT